METKRLTLLRLIVLVACPVIIKDVWALYLAKMT